MAAEAKLKISATGGKQTSDELNNVANSTKEVGKSVTDTSQMLANFARGLAQVSRAASDAADVSISAFAGFDQAMKNTQSIAKGTTADFDEMRQMALQMSSEMPQGAEEIAAGFYTLASAGLNANEILSRTPDILKLATASATDFDTTARLVNSGMAIFGDSLNSATELTDIFQNTVKGSMTNLQELGLSFQFAASSAETLGVPIELLNASIGVLRNQGLRASVAGTALRNMFSKLARPTKEAQELMEEHGIEILRNADGTLDLVGSLKTLKSFLDSTTDRVERLAVAQTIFGLRGAEAAQKLSSNTLQLRGFAKQISKSGSVQNAMNVQMEGAANRLKVLENELTNAKIRFGEAAIETEIFTTKIKIGLLNALTELPGPLAAISGGVVVVVGSLGEMVSSLILLLPGLAVLAKLSWANAAGHVADGIAATGAAIGENVYAAAVWLATEAQWALNTAMLANPIGFMVAIIVLAVAWLVFLTDALFNGSKGMQKFATVMLALFGPLGWIILLIKYWGKLMKGLSSLFKTVGNAIEKGVYAIGFAFGWLQKKITDIARWIIFIALMPILIPIKLIIAMIRNWGAIMKWVKKAFWDAIDGIVAGFWAAIDGIVYFFSFKWIGAGLDLLNDALSWFSDLGARAKKWGSDLLKGFLKGLWSGLKGIGNFFSDLWDMILDFIGFDVLKNDLAAERWGADLIHYHVLGQKKGLRREREGMSEVRGGITNNVSSVSSISNNFGTGIRRPGRYESGTILDDILMSSSADAQARGQLGGVSG